MFHSKKSRLIFVPLTLCLISLIFFFCRKDISAIISIPPPNSSDTTSHEFRWTVESLGQLTSTLSDVYAISENDIWAVGEIYADSTQPSLPYNAVHWDGQRWKFNRIYFYLCPDGNSPTPFPIKTVFAFSSDNIWFSRGGSIVHWDGFSFTHDCQINSVISGSIIKLWGEESNQLYAVGYAGSIVFYNDNVWHKLESGTTVTLFDIFGNPNGDHIWSCGYATNYSESILLHYDGIQWNTIWNWNYQQGSSDSTYEGLLRSLWVINSDTLMIVGGNGVYRQDIQGNSPPQRESLYLDAFPNHVRGSASNNIFIVGYDGMVWHYNGASWRTYPELRNPRRILFSVAVLKDKVVAVGLDLLQGIQKDLIITGERW